MQAHGRESLAVCLHNNLTLPYFLSTVTPFCDIFFPMPFIVAWLYKINVVWT